MMQIRKSENSEKEIQTSTTKIFHWNFHKKQKHAELILSVFATMGHILHFENIDELSQNIYTKPMSIIKSLRTILRHDFREPLEEDLDPNSGAWLRSIESKGMMCQEAFDILFVNKREDPNEPQLSKEDTRQLLVNLKIAWSVDNQRLFVPSLISDKSEDEHEIIKIANNKIGNGYNNQIGIMFKFNMETKTIGIYHELLMHLQSKKYCGAEGNAGVIFDQGFSQKIESRKPGWVSGMKGRLTVTMENKVKWHDFLIMELETNFKNGGGGLNEIPFSRYRCLVILLSPMEREPLTQGAWTSVSIFDNIMSDIIAKRRIRIERGLICFQCAMSVDANSSSLEQALTCETIGYFYRKQGFSCDHSSCSNNHQHHCKNLGDQKLRIMIEPASIDSQCIRMFLKNGIEAMEKVKFKLLKEYLEIGDQIWLYRNRKQNCISKIMPYAHVVIFVGNNKIVHVTPSKCGCCKGIIRKQNMKEVIKDEDETFLGHNIPGSQHSINIRDEIAKRAEACVGIKFNYDHNNNCETFANLLMGFGFSVQGEITPSAVSGMFGCVNCFKCKKNLGNLGPKIKKRLEERELLSPANSSYQRSGFCS